MDARLCEDIRQMVEKEIVNKEEMSPTDLENLGEMVDIIKDLHEIDGSQMPSGMSGGSMPYYGAIYYDSNRNGRGSSYRSNYDGQGRGYDTRSSYGRYDDMRMMPDRGWN